MTKKKDSVYKLAAELSTRQMVGTLIPTGIGLLVAIAATGAQGVIPPMYWAWWCGMVIAIPTSLWFLGFALYVCRVRRDVRREQERMARDDKAKEA